MLEKLEVVSKLHNFNKIKKWLKKTIFSKLPKHYQDSIWRRLGENHDPSDWNLNSMLVQYGEVPTDKFIEFINSYPMFQYPGMPNYMQIQKDLKYIPKHLKSNRWPILLWGDIEEPFEDGWHRLSLYIKRKDATIPVVEIDYSYIHKQGYFLND